MELLLALLTYSWGLDIDTPGKEGKTAMHIAVEVKKHSPFAYNEYNAYHMHRQWSF